MEPGDSGRQSGRADRQGDPVEEQGEVRYVGISTGMNSLIVQPSMERITYFAI